MGAVRPESRALGADLVSDGNYLRLFGDSGHIPADYHVKGDRRQNEVAEHLRVLRPEYERYGNDHARAHEEEQRSRYSADNYPAKMSES